MLNITKQLLPTTIGLETLIDHLDHILATPHTNYPPYNIHKHHDNTYTIQLAIAGHNPDHIQITHQNDTLTIQTNKPQPDDLHDTTPQQTTTIHQGISTKPFTKTFKLNPHTKPTNAEYTHGILQITLQTTNPTQTPTTIPITQTHP